MGNKRKGIPDGWLDYRSLGLVIAGTKIVAFKVPLKENLCQKHLPDEEWFTPSMLLDNLPKLKTVIDLTNTSRYYDGQEEFGTKGVDYVKILVEGRGALPTVLQLQKFFDAMDHHMEKYRDTTDALIGIHCTHGLNRTGYLVCRWMLERMSITPDDAIQRFNVARGHPIERQTLLNDLRRTNLQRVPRSTPKFSHLRKTQEYRSPLDDSMYDEPLRESRYGRHRGREGDGRRNESYNNRDGSDHYGGSDSYRGDRNINDAGRSRSFQKNDNFMIRDDTRKMRRPEDQGRSRADQDTNWRQRVPIEVGERSFQGGGGSHGGRRTRIDSDGYTSFIKKK